MTNTENNPTPDTVSKNNNVNEKEDDEESFNTLLEKLDSNGKFYTRYNILYNIVLLTLVALPHFNYILAMYVPDHSCYVPGRKNHSEEEWKNMTIPK